MDTFSDLVEKLFCFANIGLETKDINSVGGLEKVNTWKVYDMTTKLWYLQG